MKTAFDANSNNTDIAGTTATELPVAYEPTFTQGATNAARIQ
jgi:hypothetical protein